MSSLNTTVCSDPCGDIASLGAIASKYWAIQTTRFSDGGYLLTPYLRRGIWLCLKRRSLPQKGPGASPPQSFEIAERNKMAFLLCINFDVCGPYTLCGCVKLARWAARCAIRIGQRAASVSGKGYTRFEKKIIKVKAVGVAA